jgi:hypothetical protein
VTPPFRGGPGDGGRQSSAVDGGRRRRGDGVVTLPSISRGSQTRSSNRSRGSDRRSRPDGRSPPDSCSYPTVGRPWWYRTANVAWPASTFTTEYLQRWRGETRSRSPLEWPPGRPVRPGRSHCVRSIDSARPRSGRRPARSAPPGTNSNRARGTRRPATRRASDVGSRVPGRPTSRPEPAAKRLPPDHGPLDGRPTEAEPDSQPWTSPIWSRKTT